MSTSDITDCLDALDVTYEVHLNPLRPPHRSPRTFPPRGIEVILAPEAHSWNSDGCRHCARHQDDRGWYAGPDGNPCE
jgi:hypothetical protein